MSESKSYGSSDPEIKFWLMQVRSSDDSKIEVKFNGAYADKRDVPRPNTIMAEVASWVPIEASTLKVYTESQRIPKGQNWCIFSFLRNEKACFVRLREVYETREKAEEEMNEMDGLPSVIARAGEWVIVK